MVVWPLLVSEMAAKKCDLQLSPLEEAGDGKQSPRTMYN